MTAGSFRCHFFTEAIILKKISGLQRRLRRRENTGRERRRAVDRLIFHIDVNSAFLSWSAVKQLEENPDAVDLRTIPPQSGAM